MGNIWSGLLSFFWPRSDATTVKIVDLIRENRARDDAYVLPQNERDDLITWFKGLPKTELQKVVQTILSYINAALNRSFGLDPYFHNTANLLNFFIDIRHKPFDDLNNQSDIFVKLQQMTREKTEAYGDVVHGRVVAMVQIMKTARNQLALE